MSDGLTDMREKDSMNGAEVTYYGLRRTAQLGVYPVDKPPQQNVGPYYLMEGIPSSRYVYEFHYIYKHPICHVPTLQPFEVRKLRSRLLIEEVEEFFIGNDTMSAEVNQAFRQIESALDRIPSNEGENFNFQYVADAIADIKYVANGAGIAYGIPIERVDLAVHLSNLSKLGSDGQPIFRGDGKVMKGPNFKNPDLSFLPDGNGKD